MFVGGRTQRVRPGFPCEGFGLLPFRSPLLRKYLLVSIPPGTKMFQFPGCAPCIKYTVIRCYLMGFPHSEISGSKVVWHLPETYRSQTTSFIAPFSQGIHHAPLMELPVRSSTNRFVCVLCQHNANHFTFVDVFWNYQQARWGCC